jgi:formyltetrahydrofolate synthetase
VTGGYRPWQRCLLADQPKAKYVVVTAITRTMPGLAASPAAERIDIDENGQLVGPY